MLSRYALPWAAWAVSGWFVAGKLQSIVVPAFTHQHVKASCMYIKCSTTVLSFPDALPKTGGKQLRGKLPLDSTTSWYVLKTAQALVTHQKHLNRRMNFESQCVFGSVFASKACRPEENLTMPRIDARLMTLTAHAGMQTPATRQRTAWMSGPC